MTLFTLTFVGILNSEGPLVELTSPSWFLAGAHTENYRIGFDREIVRKNKPSLYLKSKLPYIRRDGTVGVLMKNIRAGQYMGKRVRFSGYVRTDAVQGWADLWIGVNNGAADAGSNVLQKRIKGTRNWKRYEVVAKVPPRATNIAIGIFLVQAGTVWLSDPSFDIIESEDCDDHGPISARRDYECWLRK